MENYNLFNFQRETHKIHHKKITDQIEGISKWITDVNGNNKDDAIAFIKKYLNHLNDNTKKSMYESILDKTDTKLLDVNKQNDLMLLINDLCKLKQQIKFI